MEPRWPPLPLDAWQDTYATLHRFAQIVGKIRMVQTPLVNHWWNVAFHFTARGWTTRPIPYHDEVFTIDFDFIDHMVVIATSRGARRAIALAPRSVADFYDEMMAVLASLGIRIAINPLPVEIPVDVIPFPDDHMHRSYDPASAERCWRILSQSATVFEEFRARFIGKSSPVHFFWGSFDLALTRFSGRKAPERPGADPITKEGYSHEVISAGFWPGDLRFPHPTYYTYAAPAPSGFAEAPVRPAGAFWERNLGEFLLPYDDVRTASAPRAALLDFLQSTYEAAAELGNWDRASLEPRYEGSAHSATHL